MAFELILQTKSIAADGKSMIVEDGSDWTQDGYGRAEYGLFIKSEFRVSDTPAIIPQIEDPATATEFTISTTSNGRYTMIMYAFNIKGGAAPVTEGVVHYDIVSGKLQKYTAGQWVDTTLENSEEFAAHTSAPLDVPVLTHAYAFFNDENLKYIKAVKKEIDAGAKQNKLFYKRTNVDYLISLIRAAEYKWGLGAYSEYYEIVLSLDNIIATGIIE